MQREANRCGKLIEGAIRSRATRQPICLLIRELFYLQPSLLLHDPVRSLPHFHYPILSLFFAPRRDLSRTSNYTQIDRYYCSCELCSILNLVAILSLASTISTFSTLSSFILFSLLISTKEMHMYAQKRSMKRSIRSLSFLILLFLSSTILSFIHKVCINCRLTLLISRIRNVTRQKSNALPLLFLKKQLVTPLHVINFEK